MKVIRELGSKRCETVWFLSPAGYREVALFFQVRKDWTERTYCVPIVYP